MRKPFITQMSFLAVLLINIIIWCYVYYFIEKIIIHNTININNNIALRYNQAVWQSYNIKDIKKINSNIYDAIKSPTIVKFAIDSFEFLKSQDANSISLYNKFGRKFSSTKEPRLTGITQVTDRNFTFYDTIAELLDHIFLHKYFDPKPPISIALKGMSTNRIVQYAIHECNDIVDSHQQQKRKFYLVSYIPILHQENLSSLEIIGVLKIKSDITNQLQNLEDIIFILLPMAMIVVIIYLVVIVHKTHYANTILTNQLVRNRKLKQAIGVVEEESYAKSHFLANMSHELRTPLNAIIGFSEIMLSDKNNTNSQQYPSYISDIHTSGKHLLSIINDILDFSQVSADKLTLQNIKFDLNKLASSTMRILKPKAEKNNVILIEDIPKHHILLNADPTRIKQALLNILSNAIKFTPPGGSVTLSIRINVTQKLVYIYVIDTGIGMKEQDIPKALSAFGQLDNSLRKRYEGTGLGLPLTKKLIESMDGTFEITSKENYGTTVTISFPYKELLNLS